MPERYRTAVEFQEDLQLFLGARVKVAENGNVVADAEKARPRTFEATAGTLLLLSRTAPKGKGG